MDAHNPQYIQDGMSLDDLMASGGWPAANEQQFYTSHPPEDPYARYTTGQTPFDQFDLTQHASFPSTSYSNSPYASQYHQPSQTQNFGQQSSYNVDPSIHTSAAFPGHDNTFSFAPQGLGTNTIAPQSLQYGLPVSQPSRNVSNPASNPVYQQRFTNVNGLGNNLSAQSQSQTQNGGYYNTVQSGNLQLNSGNSTQFSSNMQSAPTPREQPQPQKRYVEENNVPKFQQPQPQLQLQPQAQTQPRSQQTRVSSPPAQYPLRITHPNVLAAKDLSTRPRFDYAPFLVWEDTPIQIPPGLKNTVPKFKPRKSQSGKPLVAGFDLSASLKPPQISAKKQGRPPKAPKILSHYKGTSKAARGARVDNIRDDELLGSRKSPSTPTETSSSEESSSESESEYEEDMPVQDISEVRGPTRPTNPSLAARWDAIGVIWKDPHSSPNADVVKEAIEKYGNSISDLRAQLKTNSVKTDEAAARPAEVTRLRAMRLVLLDSLYQTIDAANQLGYPAIVENLGGHHKLVNGLTSTLIECVKADDYLGILPRSVFRLLARFQNMTDELLKKLKFEGISKRWNKKGDDEIKKYIVDILANTKDAKERAKTKKDIARPAEEKKVVAKEKSEPSKPRAIESSNSTTANSTKRPHEGDGTNGQPNKKFASNVAGAPTSSKPVAPKRPMSNLLGIATKPTAKPVVKKREVSPPTVSKLGALLDSIAKPPEPPKAPEAPARPAETPEEKAKRERRESRRHLRVSFKEGAELEEIHLFKHEQAEDEGRQDEMLRDAHEHRLEGLMHKKRASEVVDDEEEYQPPDVERPYQEPVGINFGPLAKATPFGPKYTSRGGDVGINTPEQQTQARREAVELMVIYTDPTDIPLTPKELNQHDGPNDTVPSKALLEPTDQWLTRRLQDIHQFGPENASKIFQARAISESQKNAAREIASSFTPSNTVPAHDLNSVMSQLGLPVPATNITINQPEISAFLLGVIQSLEKKPAHISSPPDWMIDPSRRAAWQAGYDRDNAGKLQAQQQAEAEKKAAAELEAQRYQPPPPPMMTAPQPQYTQQQPYYAQPPTIPQAPIIPPTSDIQSYLAAYQQNGSNLLGNLPQTFDFSSWAQQAQGATQPPQPQNHQQETQAQEYARLHTEQRAWLNESQSNSWNGVPEAENNRSGREGGGGGRKKKNKGGNNGGGGGNRMNDRGSGDRDGGNGGGQDPSIFDENGEYKGKKKPCKFFREGKCAKGSKCTYLHEMD